MHKLLIAVLSAAGASSMAIAADLPVKAPVYKAPAEIVRDTWTGFYLGGHVGGAWGDPSSTVHGLPSDAAWMAVAGDRGLPASFSASPTSVIAGGQIGYNYQFGQWLLGAEADFSYLRHSWSGNSSVISGGFPATYTQSQDMDWFGTVRARLGWTITNDLLLYATGGLAYGRINATDNLSFSPVTNYYGTVSTTKTGWTVGGGGEYAWNRNWSVRAEYLYYDLGDVTVLGYTTPYNGYGTTNTFTITGNIVRLGLNYRF